MARPPDGMRRIGRDHLPRYQPIEQHPDTGEVLLDRGGRPLPLQLLDIRGHMHRLDAPEFTNPLPLAPAQESSSGPRIRRPRVAVADSDGEEFTVRKKIPPYRD